MIKNINGINFNLESSIVSTTTTSTSITLMDSVLIPANTLIVGDSTIISVVANLAIIGGAYADYYLYWNTGSTVSGAIQLGYYSITTTSASLIRHLTVKSESEFYVMNPTVSYSYDYGNIGESFSTVSGIDLTTDSYFIYAAQIVRPLKGDGATTTGYQFTIEI